MYISAKYMEAIARVLDWSKLSLTRLASIILIFSFVVLLVPRDWGLFSEIPKMVLRHRIWAEIGFLASGIMLSLAFASTAGQYVRKKWEVHNAGIRLANSIRALPPSEKGLLVAYLATERRVLCLSPANCIVLSMESYGMIRRVIITKFGAYYQVENSVLKLITQNPSLLEGFEEYKFQPFEGI